MTKYLSNYCQVSANSVQVCREPSERVWTASVGGGGGGGGGGGASVGHCCHLHIV